MLEAGSSLASPRLRDAWTLRGLLAGAPDPWRAQRPLIRLNAEPRERVGHGVGQHAGRPPRAALPSPPPAGHIGRPPPPPPALLGWDGCSRWERLVPYAAPEG